jgi:hypothetical protein
VGIDKGAFGRAVAVAMVASAVTLLMMRIL